MLHTSFVYFGRPWSVWSFHKVLAEWMCVFSTSPVCLTVSTCKETKNNLCLLWFQRTNGTRFQERCSCWTGHCDRGKGKEQTHQSVHFFFSNTQTVLQTWLENDKECRENPGWKQPRSLLFSCPPMTSKRDLRLPTLATQCWNSQRSKMWTNAQVLRVFLTFRSFSPRKRTTTSSSVENSS